MTFSSYDPSASAWTRTMTLMNDNRVSIGNIGGSAMDKLTIDEDFFMARQDDAEWRNIRARTEKGALTINANNASADGPNIELYGLSSPKYGSAHFCTYVPGNTAAGFPDIGETQFNVYVAADAAWTRTMTLTSSNQVYIGDHHPNIGGTWADYKLTVDGYIVCKRVVVQISDWADDVFDAGYKLMPLNELQAYINANHHLPDVPTTKEALADGVSLDEMNVKLLRKVEELTQYVLAQQKEIEALKNKIK